MYMHVLTRVQVQVLYMALQLEVFGYTVVPLFKTIHEPKKMWSYIGDGLKIMVV